MPRKGKNTVRSKTNGISGGISRCCGLRRPSCDVRVHVCPCACLCACRVCMCAHTRTHAFFVFNINIFCCWRSFSFFIFFSFSLFLLSLFISFFLLSFGVWGISFLLAFFFLSCFFSVSHSFFLSLSVCKQFLFFNYLKINMIQNFSFKNTKIRKSRNVNAFHKALKCR